MNPAQERIAMNLAATAKKALKDAQTGSEVTPTSGSGDSSSVQATVALSSNLVSLKVKRLRVEGNFDLTREKGKGRTTCPLADWRKLFSRVQLSVFLGLNPFTLRVWTA